MKYESKKAAKPHTMNRQKKTAAWEGVRFALVNEWGMAREDVMFLGDAEALEMLSAQVKAGAN